MVRDQMTRETKCRICGDSRIVLYALEERLQPANLAVAYLDCRVQSRLKAVNLGVACRDDIAHDRIQALDLAHRFSQSQLGEMQRSLSRAPSSSIGLGIRGRPKTSSARSGGTSPARDGGSSACFLSWS